MVAREDLVYWDHMTHSNLTYRELFSAGWEKTREHFWFMLIVMALYGAVAAITFPIPIIGSIAGALIGLVFMSAVLAVAKGHVPAYEKLAEPLKNAWFVLYYLAASILVGIIVFFGFILLIIPGIYLATRLQFFTFAMIEDKTLDPIEGIKKSWNVTRGKFWRIFGFSALSMLIILISIIPFGLGLIFSLPVVSISSAILYMRLADNHTAHHEHAGEQPMLEHAA
jgi:uncharacterized membrane protein